MKVLKCSLALHQQNLLYIHSNHWNKAFFPQSATTFETTLPTKCSKFGLVTNVLSGEINCFLLRGSWWSPPQLLVVNKVFSLSLSSLISNVLLTSGFSTCDCLLLVTFLLQAFFNASTLCFEVSLFLEILFLEMLFWRLEENGIVFVEFFFVLFICVIYFKNLFSSYKYIYIIANSNFLPFAFIFHVCLFASFPVLFQTVFEFLH